MKHHTSRWHKPHVGPFLVCTCGGWQGDPTVPLGQQRKLHREHIKQESAGTVAAGSKEMVNA